MRIVLKTRWPKVLAMCAALLPSLVLAYKDIRYGISGSLAGSVSIRHVRLATRLDPQNSGAYERLALAGYFSGALSLDQEITALRQAVARSPDNELYWSELGDACEEKGDWNCATQSTYRALALAPRRPYLQFKAANYFLRRGDTARALDYSKRVLSLDSDYALPTFRIWLRADPSILVSQLVPPGSSSELEFALLRFLVRNRQFDPAQKVWESVAAGAGSFTFDDANNYVEDLILADRFEQAGQVWKEMLRRGVLKSTSADSQNLVYNGDFHDPPLNAGFGWRIDSLPYVFTSPSNEQTPAGQDSLRVDFTGEQNLEGGVADQFVLVDPKTTYRLQFLAKSASITSDTGPCLRVTDPACPACLDARSPVTTGTTAWHPLTLDFKTGDNTRAIRLWVWRDRSRVFPQEISGTFWLSAISITQVNPDH
jgi:hypothetical protein